MSSTKVQVEADFARLNSPDRGARPASGRGATCGQDRGDGPRQGPNLGPKPMVLCFACWGILGLHKVCEFSLEMVAPGWLPSYTYSMSLVVVPLQGVRIRTGQPSARLWTSLEFFLFNAKKKAIFTHFWLSKRSQHSQSQVDGPSFPSNRSLCLRIHPERSFMGFARWHPWLTREAPCSFATS